MRHILAHMEKTEDPPTANFKKALADWRAKSANPD